MRLWSRSQKIAKMITQRKTQKIAKLKLKSTSTIGCQLFVPFFASGISQPSWISQAGTSFGVFSYHVCNWILVELTVGWISVGWVTKIMANAMTTIDGHSGKYSWKSFLRCSCSNAMWRAAKELTRSCSVFVESTNCEFLIPPIVKWLISRAQDYFYDPQS